MTKYFQNTPYYKIWIYVIDCTIPKFSFLITDKLFISGDVICNRSGVHFIFLKDKYILELYFNQPSKQFICTFKDAQTDKIIPFKFTDSEKESLFHNFNDLEDFEKVMENWKNFILKQFTGGSVPH